VVERAVESTLESLSPEDQSLWRISKQVMTVHSPFLHLVSTVAIALSNFEKAKTLADILETQFQAVSDFFGRGRN
jgi:hypothetical protein